MVSVSTPLSRSTSSYELSTCSYPSPTPTLSTLRTILSTSNSSSPISLHSLSLSPISKATSMSTSWTAKTLYMSSSISCLLFDTLQPTNSNSSSPWTVKECKKSQFTYFISTKWLMSSSSLIFPTVFRSYCQPTICQFKNSLSAWTDYRWKSSPSLSSRTCLP